MPPAVPYITEHGQIHARKRSASFEFHKQWRNPGDIFSLLLIIGADIIQTALAQQSGYLVTPTVFSFGWVAYAFNTLLSVFGGKNLVVSR